MNETDKENTPHKLSREQWREKLVHYYSTNAPEKVTMVSDSLLDKWADKYDDLYANIIQKYGPLGTPIVPSKQPSRSMAAPKAVPSRVSSAGSNSKPCIANFHDEFVKLVAAATPSLVSERGSCPPTSVIDNKVSKSANGLETSTFTLCTRIRPKLPHEEGKPGDSIVCVVPGPTTFAGGEQTQATLVMTPKVSMTGEPKLEQTSFDFDHTFGPDSTNDEVYSAVGAPLARRALAGSVGVIFAYGQTGSGKTHTMNGIMDGIINDLYRDEQIEKRQTKFSYLEVLGSTISDCLGRDGPAVQIGEALDGRVLTRNLSEHVVRSRTDLIALVKVAQKRRSTAATEKNDASSRSHGIAILEVGQPQEHGYQDVSLTPGRLYIIDLAGSERAADSKEHSKARMDETKAINLSLMSLKECIRARTMAGGGLEVHVPYRRSKLTLLMKDVFNIGCARLCATVVVANVSPLAQDIAHSTNTLQYAAPLRVAASQAITLELDPRDPVLWTHEQMETWLSEAVATQQRVNFDVFKFVARMSGAQICMLSESEFHKRVRDQIPGSEGGSLAQLLYSELWAFIVDAKSRKRTPKGKIITEEQEAGEQQKAAERRRREQEVWKEREKHLHSELSFNDQGLSTG